MDKLTSNDKVIRLSKSCLSDAEKKAVLGVLDREFLGMGEEVRQFEEALEAYFGRPVVCVVNGTAALQLSVQFCVSNPGDEILVPSLTYVASFQAISAAGAVAVACEVDAKTCLLDLADAEKRLTPRTRAVMPIHYGGGVGELDEVYAFAKRHSLRVIEDAAHAFGTIYQGRKIGSFGDITCFSFDGIKNITSGEGGCVVLDDPDILSGIRDARLLGVENDTDQRYTGQRSWEFNVRTQGWRYHMSNVMAAIGIEQLKQFPRFAEARQRLAKLYHYLLSGESRVELLPRDYNQVVPHIFVVRIPGLKNRSVLQNKLLKQGIQTGVHYQPNHKLSFYYSHTLPVTELLYSEILTLPLHPDMTEENVNEVCKKLSATLT